MFLIHHGSEGYRDEGEDDEEGEANDGCLLHSLLMIPTAQRLFGRSIHGEERINYVHIEAITSHINLAVYLFAYVYI